MAREKTTRGEALALATLTGAMRDHLGDYHPANSECQELFDNANRKGAKRTSKQDRLAAWGRLGALLAQFEEMAEKDALAAAEQSSPLTVDFSGIPDSERTEFLKEIQRRADAWGVTLEVPK